MNAQNTTTSNDADLIAITKDEFRVIFNHCGYISGLYGDHEGLKNSNCAVKVGSMAHDFYLDFIANGTLAHREHLTQAVQDTIQGMDWRVLKEAAKFGFVRLPKSRRDIDKIINSLFVEVVEHKDYMTHHIRFDNDEVKNKFINDYYFIKLTDIGVVAVTMRKQQDDRLMEATCKHQKEMQELKHNIARKLLSTIGLDDVTIDENSNYW